MGISIMILRRVVPIALIVIIGAVGAWMLITPIYQFILDSVPIVPTVGWMIVGAILLFITVKFGIHVLF